jgi:hypothetical protein
MRLRHGVIGCVALALVLGGCASGLPQASEDAAEGSVTLFDLKLGDCLNDADIPLRSDMTDVPRVSCEQPHDSELFAILGVEGSAFPGERELVSQGQDRCARAFGDFIGIPFANSALDFRFYYPTASSWAQGDKTIYCLAFDPGLQVSGTLLGAKR